jgi:2-polyprenyl-6-methoxyphenol hydroxylase-like FAD-dependent oxidoreductase
MSLPSEGALAAGPNRRAPGPEEAADTEVLIVGAGPVGCWLAAELCAAGVRAVVLEARESRASWSRGFVVHPRTLEILASRGAVAPMLEAGRQLPTWHFAMGSRKLDFTALPTGFPHILIQPQARTEELLEAHLNRCGGAVLRGQRVLDLTQHADRVAVQVQHGDDTPRTITARFVVGCDGARSTVRRAAGIGFNGNPDTMVSPSALVELADPPPPEQYMQTREHGLFFAIALPDGRFIVSTIDHAAMNDVDATWTAEMVRDSLRRITGTDYGMGEAERVSTLGNSAKQADRYRDHRVLLAGDAAHVHFPMGGQGLNLGLQDAHNLAWRLTSAVRTQRAEPWAKPPEALLDGYEAERRPAGERVLEDVRAQMALVAAVGADGAALRRRFDALLSEHPAVNLQYALRLSGLDVRYPMADGGTDPRLGMRVPDLELELEPESELANPSAEAADAGGTVRLYDLLRDIGPGRFIRLAVSGGGAASVVDAAADAVPAETADEAAEPVMDLAARAVLGPDWALSAGWGRGESVLIRPDGHIAQIAAAGVVGTVTGTGAGPGPSRPVGHTGALS